MKPDPIITQKLSSTGFRSIQDQERELRRKHEDRVRSFQEAISFADKILQLRNQPGFQDFIGDLKDRREHLRSQIELEEGSVAMRIMQGRCRELAYMISLTTKTENRRQTLATQLKAEQDSFAAIERRLKETNP